MNRSCDELKKLHDISTEGCDQIRKMLVYAVTNTDVLMMPHVVQMETILEFGFCSVLKPNTTGDEFGVGKPVHGVASDILARACLLPRAIHCILEDVLRNDVDAGLRAATFFFKTETYEGCTQ